MNQHVYFNILDDQVLPFSQHLHDEYALVTPIFQDDNNTVHRAGRICYCARIFGIKNLPEVYFLWPELFLSSRGFLVLGADYPIRGSCARESQILSFEERPVLMQSS
ncbi:hypothetical protein AVEN_143125-1 [Araneus ventricosus]|uniref:Uncharacterized protein n=1 Tax=Araneus ventricosus TaxID=182803 RepID=A0A4Y2QAV7_ARAVE|nr:hypothetical protein AVEN_143125-1 [Araneus ventricosus]